MNILDNAFLAVNEGGKVAFSMKIDGEPEKLVFVVSDDGIGIRDEFVKHLGQPFMSGWDGGMHAGMGLAVAKSVFESHGGGIDFSSTPGQGTTVKAWMPLEMEKA